MLLLPALAEPVMASYFTVYQDYESTRRIY